MTQVEKAEAEFNAARERLKDVLRKSCRALYDGGFRLRDCSDPLRNQAWDEIEAEAKGGSVQEKGDQ